MTMVAHNVAMKRIERLMCLALGATLGLAACSSLYEPGGPSPAAEPTQSQAGAAGSIFGAASAPELEEVVVTGNRLRRQDFSSATPLTTVDG